MSEHASWTGCSRRSALPCHWGRRVHSLQEHRTQRCRLRAACATGVGQGACYRRPALPAAWCGRYRSIAPSLPPARSLCYRGTHRRLLQEDPYPCSSWTGVSCAQHFLSLSPFDKQPCISVYLVLQLQTSSELVSWMLPLLRISAGQCRMGRPPPASPPVAGLHAASGAPHVAPQAEMLCLLWVCQAHCNNGLLEVLWLLPHRRNPLRPRCSSMMAGAAGLCPAVYAGMHGWTSHRAVLLATAVPYHSL